MARTTARRKGHDLLGIYLNDHLAGATGGVGLARRMAAAADPGSESARVLSTVAAEIAQDRVALITIMGTLGIPVRGYKVFAGWAGEKAGRVKLNGHLLTRSSLSELEETELLPVALRKIGDTQIGNLRKSVRAAILQTAGRVPFVRPALQQVGASSDPEDTWLPFDSRLLVDPARPRSAEVNTPIVVQDSQVNPPTAFGDVRSCARYELHRTDQCYIRSL